MFAHGVASGDPLPDGVVIWTRVSPPSGRPSSVGWRVATTSDLGAPVAAGQVEAAPENDFTVKVDVRGLEPATAYHYGFTADGTASPVGRTRTAPAGPTERVRIGVVSCACWPHGFFNAYRHLADRDVDLVLHLGDYIYEDGGSWDEAGRSHEPPRRLRTLADYRARHAQYKTDPDLRRLHERHPVIAIWDDHDLADGAWWDGAARHDKRKDGDWARRRDAAIRAWVEWLPVRLRDDDHPERIYRSFRLGDLAHLAVVDSRLVGRDRPPADGKRTVLTVEEPDRSMLGADQRRWLQHELRSSAGRWQLLANQVMMAPLRALELPRPLRWLVPGLVAGGAGINGGQWDGYPGEREALFRLVRGEGIVNFVVLSGDLHSSWAGELTDPAGEEPAVGVEFVAPSVTSRAFSGQVAPRLPGARAALRRLVATQNPHFRYFDLDQHGYLVVDVTADQVRTQFWHVDTVAHRAAGEYLAAEWLARDGEARLVAGRRPVRPPSGPPDRRPWRGRASRR
ncbi:MAG TPA: alkaline phosphatase D family protein [Acidimicrobiales bacterium]|nr:alkaline phosphatase D family protein [Acidimicrobiales bacterium]